MHQATAAMQIGSLDVIHGAPWAKNWLSQGQTSQQRDSCRKKASCFLPKNFSLGISLTLALHLRQVYNRAIWKGRYRSQPTKDITWFSWRHPLFYGRLLTWGPTARYLSTRILSLLWKQAPGTTFSRAVIQRLWISSRRQWLFCFGSRGKLSTVRSVP